MKRYNIRNYNEDDFKAFESISEKALEISINDDDQDFGWIDIFESYIPILDIIIRNPRRFIQSEENLVPIEKAKKFTEESIKHLAQNTQLIQDIDKDGMPQPLKVLNVYKEETYDLYENRFVHSLIENLYYFLQFNFNKLKGEGETYLNGGKEIKYSSSTTIDNITYDSKLNITINDNTNKEKLDLSKILEKVENMYTVVSGFKNSTIMKELERAEPVRSPIRKTNAILKDVQLNKCLELWEILERYQNDITLDEYENNKQETKNEDYIDGLNLTNYLNYCILTNKPNEITNITDINPKDAFRSLIKKYIRRKDVGISNLKREIVNDLDTMCQKYIAEYYKVEAIYDKLLNDFETDI